MGFAVWYTVLMPRFREWNRHIGNVFFLSLVQFFGNIDKERNSLLGIGNVKRLSHDLAKWNDSALTYGNSCVKEEGKSITYEA